MRDEEPDDDHQRDESQQGRLDERKVSRGLGGQHVQGQADDAEDTDDGHDHLEPWERVNRLGRLPHGGGVVGGGRADAVVLADGSSADLAQAVVFARPSPVGRFHVSIPVRQCVCRHQVNRLRNRGAPREPKQFYHRAERRARTPATSTLCTLRVSWIR